MLRTEIERKKSVLEELYSNCYLYVLPSVVEGVSQAALRALSYGRAVLVSDIKENLDAVGNFGFTFKNKDVEDLKEKLETLLNNKNLVEGEEKKRKEESMFRLIFPGIGPQSVWKIYFLVV